MSLLPSPAGDAPLFPPRLRSCRNASARTRGSPETTAGRVRSTRSASCSQSCLAPHAPHGCARYKGCRDALEPVGATERHRPEATRESAAMPVESVTPGPYRSDRTRSFHSEGRSCRLRAPRRRWSGMRRHRDPEPSRARRSARSRSLLSPGPFRLSPLARSTCFRGFPSGQVQHPARSGNAPPPRRVPSSPAECSVESRRSSLVCERDRTMVLPPPRSPGCP